MRDQAWSVRLLFVEKDREIAEDYGARLEAMGLDLLKDPPKAGALATSATLSPLAADQLDPSAANEEAVWLFLWSRHSLPSETAYRHVHSAMRARRTIVTLRLDATPGTVAPALDFLLSPRLAVTAPAGGVPTDATLTQLKTALQPTRECGPAFVPAALLSAPALLQCDEQARQHTALGNWIETASPLQVAVVHGPAGSGKTALLAAVSDRLRARGWLAGFVAPAMGATQVEWSAGRPTLLVLDEAHLQPEVAGELLSKLAEASGNSNVKRRVVFVARHLETWLAELRSTTGVARRLLADQWSLELPPPVSPECTTPADARLAAEHLLTRERQRLQQFNAVRSAPQLRVAAHERAVLLALWHHGTPTAGGARSAEPQEHTPAILQTLRQHYGCARDPHFELPFRGRAAEAFLEALGGYLRRQGWID